MISSWKPILIQSGLDGGQKINYKVLHISRGTLVTWRSKKQPILVKSNTEAEFKATAQGICEQLAPKTHKS